MGAMKWNLTPSHLNPISLDEGTLRQTCCMTITMPAFLQPRELIFRQHLLKPDDQTRHIIMWSDPTLESLGYQDRILADMHLAAITFEKIEQGIRVSYYSCIDAEGWAPNFITTPYLNDTANFISRLKSIFQ